MMAPPRFCPFVYGYFFSFSIYSLIFFNRLISLFEIGTISCLSILTNETISNSTTMVNGSAEISEAVCRAFNPPVNRRTLEMAAINTPHTIFTLLRGFRAPLEVILAIIYVAESAEVMRKVKMSSIPIIDATIVNGSCSSIWNNATVKSVFTASAIFVPAFKSK